MAAVARPELQIRAMRREDLSVVSTLEIESYDFPWSEGIFADCLRVGHPCWTLWDGDLIVGYGILSVAAGEAHVLNLCIGAEHRSRGLGRHLMRRLLDIARWNQAERIFLEVRPSNPMAIALYESLGFRQIGRRPRYYPAREGREDALVMALELVPPGAVQGLS